MPKRQADPGDTTMGPKGKKQLKKSDTRTHEENQERAYTAASRRLDRSIEARIQSALQASEIHFQRTGRRFRITQEIVEKEGMYEEEDDIFPRSARLLDSSMVTESETMNEKIAALMNVRMAMSAWVARSDAEWRQNQVNKRFEDAFPNAMEQAMQLTAGYTGGSSSSLAQGGQQYQHQLPSYISRQPQQSTPYPATYQTSLNLQDRSSSQPADSPGGMPHTLGQDYTQSPINSGQSPSAFRPTYNDGMQGESQFEYFTPQLTGDAAMFAANLNMNHPFNQHMYPEGQRPSDFITDSDYFNPQSTEATDKIEADRYPEYTEESREDEQHDEGTLNQDSILDQYINWHGADQSSQSSSKGYGKIVPAHESTNPQG